MGALNPKSKRWGTTPFLGTTIFFKGGATRRGNPPPYKYFLEGGDSRLICQEVVCT